MAVDSAEIRTRVFDLIIKILESLPTDLPPPLQDLLGPEELLPNVENAIYSLAYVCESVELFDVAVETFRNELLLEVQLTSSRETSIAGAARSAVQLTSAALHRTKTAVMVRQASRYTRQLLDEGISPVDAGGFTPFSGPMASVQRLAPRLHQPRATRQASLDRDFSFRVPKDTGVMIAPPKPSHLKKMEKLSLVDEML